jgi:hypothetical protein
VEERKISMLAQAGANTQFSRVELIAPAHYYRRISEVMEIREWMESAGMKESWPFTSSMPFSWKSFRFSECWLLRRCLSLNDRQRIQNLNDIWSQRRLGAHCGSFETSPLQSVTIADVF